MKTTTMKIVFALCLMAGAVPAAQAKYLRLEDDAALAFYQRHGDELNSPQGTPRNAGVFHYVNRNGLTRRGYADCWIQPNADAIWCDINY